MNTRIVLLYGLFDPKRKDYVDYLSFIAKDIRIKELGKIILCGGYTDPKKPKESEALSAMKYLKGVNPNFINYILEDKSINTNQNLEFAAKDINNLENITVYCDLTRLAKVIWMSMHFLLNEKQAQIYAELFKFTYQKNHYKPFVYKNLSVIGFDFPGKTKEEMIGQSFATLLDVMAVYNKNYNEMDIQQRKKDFGLS